jgi:hypothetical protein
MEQTYKKRYRLFIQDFQGSWRYERSYTDYFDSMDDALDHAAALNLKGYVEEWTTDELEDGSGGIDIVDLLCEDYKKFNYENKNGTAKLEWHYVYEDRSIPTPGYVFNYFKHYVDEYTILADVVEVIEDKDDQTWVA